MLEELLERFKKKPSVIIKSVIASEDASIKDINEAIREVKKEVKNDSTKIYKRIKSLYEVISDLKDYPIPIPRIYDIKSQNRFYTNIYVGTEHSFNFDSNLGLVTFSIKINNSYSCFNNPYVLKYYKKDDLLFSIACYEDETKIYPQIFKDSEIKANDINLAIYEVEAYLKELGLDKESIQTFHKEQIKLLEE